MDAGLNSYYDVLIIGAGPAASAAAIMCINSELSVCIIAEKCINKKEYSESPSESLHPGVVSLLNIISAENALSENIRSTYTGIVTNGIYNDFGSDSSGQWEGMHINKTGFSKSLLQMAKEKGTILIEEKVCKLILKDRRITGIETFNKKVMKSKFVIDASGRQRFAGRFLKFRQVNYSKPLMVYTGISSTNNNLLHNELHTSFFVENSSWFWLAPEPQNRCTWTKLSKKAGLDFSPPEILKPFTKLSETKVFNMRWSIFRPLVQKGLLLCGDAAAIIDPAAGHGIFMALASGIMAAKCIDKCNSTPDQETIILTEYDQWYVEQYEMKIEMLSQYYKTVGIHL